LQEFEGGLIAPAGQPRQRITVHGLKHGEDPLACVFTQENLMDIAGRISVAHDEGVTGGFNGVLAGVLVDRFVICVPEERLMPSRFSVDSGVTGEILSSTEFVRLWKPAMYFHTWLLSREETFVRPRALLVSAQVQAKTDKPCALLETRLPCLFFCKKVNVGYCLLLFM
jgi:hypothetical protein